MNENWLESLVKDGTVTVGSPTVPWPDGYDPHAENRPDLKRILGGLLIDWLNYADEQGPESRWLGGTQRKPADGCWRDAGWRAGAEIIRKAFAGDRYVHVLRPGEVIPLTADRWSVFPDEFVASIQLLLGAERARWVQRDGSNFYGASGALSCCLAAIQGVRKEFTCHHEWGRIRPRPYSYDEPPEPDYRRCEKCGLEVDVED